MKKRTINEIRSLFLEFWKERGHAILPSASLIPENDPTVLFNIAGMQPLVPYLLGESHPLGSRLASSQKCLRTNDIDEIGDATHGTFFEMLGNWSLGDYFKKEAITWSFEFLTDPNYLGLDPQKIFVTVFKGDDKSDRDEESINYWQAQFEVHGISAEVGQVGVDKPASSRQGARIYAYSAKENWWKLNDSFGPCGPDTEIFYDTGKEHDPAFGPVCHPNCDCGRFVEIWNNVFMQYQYQSDGSLENLKKHNIDTGMGLERITAIVQNVPSIYDVEFYQKLINIVLSKKEELVYGQDKNVDRSLRIIVDHLRASVMLIGDRHGVEPSNVDQGYIVRRLLRRAIREAKKLGLNSDDWLLDLAREVVILYQDVYSELKDNKDKILLVLEKEFNKFTQTLDKGLRELEKIIERTDIISGKDAFVLYSTYGFPIELVQEVALEKGIKVNVDDFEKEFVKHQALSRTASAGRFKGGLADNGLEAVKLHTATHLLHQALRDVLGEHVQQKGSNITADRLRFDFLHNAKLTPEEKAKVENIVNEAIKRHLDVKMEEKAFTEAKAEGALGFFEDKYGDKVKVYTVLDSDSDKGYFSKEICGGPHVKNTQELGKFKIKKEESAGAGVRRIKAVLEDES